MGKSRKAPDVKMPTAAELGPIIELQAQANRVGVETPFGSQNYRRNADGTTTMVTDIGPEGRALVGRAVGLGMTDSTRMQAPQQVNAIASALANRIGGRFGIAPGRGFDVSGQAPMPAAKPMPQTQQAPQPQLPVYGPPSGGGGDSYLGPTIGGNRPGGVRGGDPFTQIREAFRNQRMP